MSLVVVGSCSADIYIKTDRLPDLGETLSAADDSGFVLPGGKGANQAAAGARLLSSSSSCMFVGNWGDDAHGTYVSQCLTDAGVDTSLSNSVKGPTGQAYIFLSSTGENSIIIVGAANKRWPEEGFSVSIQDAIRQSNAVLLQREIPASVNMAAAKLAHAHGVRVIMDVGGQDTPMDPAIFPYLDVLSPNETELSRVSKLPTNTEEQVIAAAQSLIEQGVKNVLVKLGARGSLLIASPPSSSSEEKKELTILRQPALTPAQGVVDTTGAGDAFTAAFAVGLVENKTYQEAMRFATAAATLAIQCVGAMPSMPTRAPVDEILSQCEQ